MKDPLARIIFPWRRRNQASREVAAEYPAAREVGDRVELGQEVDPGDVAAAINGLRSIYDFVIAELEPV